MGRDPLQHIDQVVVGIDPLQAAGGDQALHDADVVGPQLGPAKQPAAPPHGNRAQGPLDRVGVDGHVRIREEDREPRAALAGIGERRGEWVPRQQALRLELAVYPGKEARDDRLGMPQAVIALLGTRQAQVSGNPAAL